MRSRYSLWIGILTTAGVVSVVSGCGGDSGSSPGSAAAQLSAKTAVAAAASSPAANLSASLGLANLRAKALLALLTQDEKLQLIHSEYQMSQVPLGGGGYIQGVPRLGIPDLNMVDSSTGGGSTMEPSTTFPATIAVAASWNRRLSYDYGAQIAKQLREQGFAMGLGGGTNLTREPRGGRTFEYLGEDPLLAGEMLAQRTSGTQSQKVIATIKHFAGNEQETGRGGGNSQIDERTLRELYLRPFEIAVKEANPGSVMCGYNMLNGFYTCENQHLLNDILKNDWQFQGQIQSDWGATHSTANAINAGLDEEEDVGPTVFLTPTLVTQALQSHAITQSRLDDMVRRKLYTMIRLGVMDDPAKPGGTVDFDQANAFAQRTAEHSMVLLKNNQGQLPLAAASLKNIAVIGGHADAGILAGGGSGNTRDPVTGAFAGCGGLTFPSGTGCHWWPVPWLKVNPTIVQSIQQMAPNATVTYSGNTDQNNPFVAYTQQQIDAAVALASKSDVAIVVVVQPAGEDFADLGSLSLSNPSNQNELVQAVANVNPHTIVVLENGNPVLMPWIDNVSAVVEAWFPGQAGGPAIANLLFGKIYPEGRLPVTFPVRDQDTPTWGQNGTFSPNPVYSEKLKMGYRWYDSQNIKPLFEFGYGLSYTHFKYSRLSVHTTPWHDLIVSFRVKNDGQVAGVDVPQLYLGINDPSEPPKRLAGWDRLNLQPGEEQTVRLVVSPQDQSIWDVANNAWKFVPGSKVYVGASSRDIRLTGG
ncbi:MULTISPECIES: glycoside hydrolase family 3 protein [Paraburkholderia]|uniref:beta-glucosidase n=1 Tax=Paraburkholderia TaxID=1822464 RepID=UPI00224FFF35|nr:MULTISPECIES: glycoside hydrolase family 3 C-terminal domain-containing protein [Paraburkholderia]MCX4164159.1 glycoside hydrolase family 3 C-terminal domain-containing protein [Paraburkholderia megapolitana]MDN7159653.1 glycoside hydrolase family 3 C-terminal domain-containing protein [Paraburkholderia sp. CHISQ3]MDQ6496700.1 glycoside hydrolase family 3 C-terminal domain-containing protein [Paraburkholderia megapolitana]